MSDTQDFPPDWAIEEALRRAGSVYSVFGVTEGTANTEVKRAILAHARTIAQHEQPPEDPDLAEAREIVIEVWADFGVDDDIRGGKFDKNDVVKAALAGLKRRPHAR